MPFGAKETQTLIIKVSNSAKIKNRYNQVPHLTQDIDGKVTNSQSDTSECSDSTIPNSLAVGLTLQRHG